MTLRDLLKRDFEIEFPISGGTGNSRDNPIVVHRVEPNDYTSVEWGIIRCICTGRGVTWNSTGQALIGYQGRKLDQLQIETIDFQEDQMIQRIENYYFDITECLSPCLQYPSEET